MNIAEFKNIPYGLPTKSFSCMVLGSRGSGKSQLIKKLCGIYMPQIEKENRFLLSPTAKLDDTLVDYFDDENIFEDYSDDAIDVITDYIKTRMDKLKQNIKEYTMKKLKVDNEQILDNITKERIEKAYNKNLKKMYKPEHNILIIEDALGTFKIKSKLTYLFTRHRWYNLTIIISSQSFRSLPVVMRNNCVLNFIFQTNNKELKKIAEEFSNYRYDNNFIRMFNKYVYGYNTLLINRTKPKTKQYFQNIDKYIDMKDFE
jgi:energy-coupling factor transporter ATP-binding protein EcfA2